METANKIFKRKFLHIFFGVNGLSKKREDIDTAQS